MTLLFYFLLYFLLAFVWRSVVVYRRTGENPLVLTAEDNAYGYVGRAFKVVIGIVALTVMLNAVRPDVMVWLGAPAILLRQSIAIIGWLVLLSSLLWLLVAQAHLGNSWRVGIDCKNHTELVSTGLFAISRNPIFLAMRVNLLGLFLVLPNSATLILLVAGELLMQVQVRLEEVHLAALHGEQYQAYAGRVRRWL